MKQKDIALIVVVVVVSGLVSFFVARMFFSKPGDRQVKAEYVQPITDTFTTPNTKYFNANSIDPTQQIQIGDGTNTAPYDATRE